MKKTVSLTILLPFIILNISAKTITVTSNADSGTGTLREAISNAANGDIIVFAENVTTVYFSGVIKLNKNITINGNEENNTIFQNAEIWIDAVNKKRYFEVLNGAIVTFNYLTLKDNTANCSGGVINNSGKLTLNNCIFSNNRPVDNGGVISNSNTGILIIDNCTFSNNYAPQSGGAICSFGELIITNSNFNDNNSRNGAAIFLSTPETITNYIANCTFTNNTAQYGSAIANSSNLNIDKCSFIENNSTAALGIIINTRMGMDAYSNVLAGKLMGFTSRESDILISNSIFSKNTSSSREVFTNCFDANATIINCLFTENITQSPSNNSQHKYYPDWQNHGIISNLNIVGYKYNISESKSKLTIINSTIADNAGFGLYTNGEIYSYNNIIEGNESEDVFINEGTGIINHANNLIGTSNTDLNENNNIIGENPLFVDAKNGNYTLQEESPAIDAGNNTYLLTGTTSDLPGNLRISNSTVDLGAYEYQHEPVIGVLAKILSYEDVKIYTQNHSIIIENTTEAVSIYRISGQFVAQGAGAGSYTVPQAGVYIVRTGSEVRKVIVP